MTEPTKEQIAAGVAALDEALVFWRIHAPEDVVRVVLEAVLPMTRPATPSEDAVQEVAHD